MTYQIEKQQENDLTWTFNIRILEKVIQEKQQRKIQEVAGKVNLPGFRPGKVPMQILQQRFGAQYRLESIRDLATHAGDDIIKQQQLQPARQPDIQSLSGETEGDLSFELVVDTAGNIDISGLDQLKLRRYRARIDDQQVDELLQQIADSNAPMQPVDTVKKSVTGDQLVMNFVGTIAGKEFPGGKAEKFNYRLGSNQLIPGFDSQLVGLSKGDRKQIKIDFPADYSDQDLAGKPAVFAVEIIDHQVKGVAKVDDKLVAALKMESMEQLRKVASDSLRRRNQGLEDEIARRNLLDVLDQHYQFPVAKRLIDSEFDLIWQRLETAKKNNTLSAEEQQKDEATLRKEFKEIAARRVRLGLLLARVSEQNKLTVGEQEITQAIANEAQRHPGQENKVVELYQRNPAQRERLRGPLLEDKTIAFILGKVASEESEVDFATLSKIHASDNQSLPADKAKPAAQPARTGSKSVNPARSNVNKVAGKPKPPQPKNPD